ncbi:MAG TPA: DUF3311 domain-containing protein [Candidatus Eremiobacteraceae bacterium]|nr:DUF3311 domain-containing protein [Candidatus Eremiobacteraceae bacterium]
MKSGAPPRARRWPYFLLLVPFAATLFPQFYAHAEPAMFGIPFFYWYQFAWIAGTGVLMAIIFALTRPGDR